MFQSINNFTASIGRQRKPFLALREKRKEKQQRVSSLIKVSAAQITFVDPDGKEISTSSSSGIVRNLALENNVEIYEGFNKLLNCGGNGQCGTCGMIITTDGKDVLSAPTEVEPNGDSERERSGECDQYHVQNETAEEVILMRREQKEKGRERERTGCRGARSFEGLLNTARVSSAAKAFSRSLSHAERGASYERLRLSKMANTSAA
jgi:ferredoxin